MKPIIVILAVCMSACGMTPKPRLIMDEYDVVHRDGQFYEQFERAYYASYCAEISNLPELPPASGTRVARSTRHDEVHETPDCSSWAHGHQPAAAALEFWRAGVRLSSVQCDAYFDRLTNNSQDTRYGRGALTITSSAVVAIMEANNAATDTIANASLGFSSLLAGAELFEEVYHFTPNLHKLRAMVGRAQATYISNVDTTVPMNHHNAFMALRAYQNLCQLSEIQRLVDASIESATFEVSSTTARDELGRQVSAQSRHALARGLSRAVTGLDIDGLSVFDTAILVGWVDGTFNSAEDRVELAALLSANGLEAVLVAVAPQDAEQRRLRLEPGVISEVAAWLDNQGAPAKSVLQIGMVSIRGILDRHQAAGDQDGESNLVGPPSINAEEAAGQFAVELAARNPSAIPAGGVEVE
jgi:hypothetical protein